MFRVESHVQFAKAESLKASFKTRQHVTFPRIFEIKRIPACHCMELYGKINRIAFIPLQIEFVM